MAKLATFLMASVVALPIGLGAAQAANIVETAQSAGQFNTLLQAAQAAGLAEELASGGPYTVFAPTDAAFAALPAGTVEDLLKPENREQLTSLLRYHIVSGSVTSGQIEPGSVATLAGQEIDLSLNGGSVMVDDANVVTADVQADNGVIHIIDKVLMSDAM